MTKLDRLIAEFCPNGVEYVKLEEVADIGTGSSNTVDGRSKGMYPFFVRSQEVRYMDTYEFDETAIITSGDGVGVGKIFHYVEGKYALHQRAYRIHIRDDRLSPKFFYCYMTAMFFDYISMNAFHASVTSIRRPMLNAFPVPLPPLQIQQEVVRILDKFAALKSDLEIELQAELTARKKQYEYYRIKLLAFDNTVPIMELGEIAEFRYGFTDTAKDNGTARFIRITDIGENGKLQPTDCKYIDLSKDSENYLLKNGDLLMARTGATYGKTMLFEGEEPAVYASFLIKIRFADNTILPAYYWHFAQSSLYWKQANKLVSKAGQPQFNANALKNVLIPVPSIDKQKRIIELLDRFDILSNDISSGLPAEITARQKQYEYYRDKLLTF